MAITNSETGSRERAVVLIESRFKLLLKSVPNSQLKRGLGFSKK